MKLVAMTMCHNELRRYLRPQVKHLLRFCDEIRALDDGSSDGSAAWLEKQGVKCLQMPTSSFYEHEGRARQRLLEWTMEAQPTHILSIDADEFVTDGPRLRALLDEPNASGVWGLQMQEVWKVSEQALMIRQDGGWREHPVGVLFAVPDLHPRHRQHTRGWRIQDRALACGRVPQMIVVAGNHAGGGTDTGVQILHFGWANENDRDQRYQRYVTHDSGQFHDNKHLQSIMWDDSRVSLTPREWPTGIDKQTVLRRALK